LPRLLEFEQQQRWGQRVLPSSVDPELSIVLIELKLEFEWEFKERDPQLREDGADLHCDPTLWELS